MKRLLLPILALSMLLGVTTGCNSDKGSDDDSSAETNGEEYLIGEIIKIGDLTVKLNGVRRLPVDEFDAPMKEGDIFIAVDVTLENTSEGSGAKAMRSQFSLVDSSGREAVLGTHGEANELGEDELATGRTRRGEVVFEVSPDARGLMLTFTASGEGQGRVVWGVGDAAGID